MSRIGNRKLVIPEGVTITEENNVVTVKGPKGTISRTVSDCVDVKVGISQPHKGICREDGIYHEHPHIVIYG